MHEALSRRRLTGLVIGFVGVVTLLGLDVLGGPLGWIGAGCVVIATLGYAMGSLIVQRYLKGVDELGAVAASLVVAAVVMLPPAVAYGADQRTLRSGVDFPGRARGGVHRHGIVALLLPSSRISERREPRLSPM